MSKPNKMTINQAKREWENLLLRRDVLFEIYNDIEAKWKENGLQISAAYAKYASFKKVKKKKAGN